MRRRIFRKVGAAEDGTAIAVPRMVRTRHYAEQPVALSDGSAAIVFRCRDCQKTPVDQKKLMRQIKLAWVEEMTVADRGMKDKKDVIARTKELRIL